jgi:hypothetical protein
LNGTPASAPGETIVMPPALIASSGLQSITVGGDGSTAFTLEIYRNASLEAEVGESDEDNELAIDGSFLPLGSGRFGVVGVSTATAAIGAIYEANMSTDPGWTLEGGAGAGNTARQPALAATQVRGKPAATSSGTT